MEFRIRAADNKSAQTSTPPPPAVPMIAVNPPLFQGGIPRANNASQREIEKQKIRQEILATENLRRELEIEVRREIAMERALQRSFAAGPHGFAFQQWSLCATPTLNPIEGVPRVSQPEPPQVVAPPETESSPDPSKDQVFVLDKNDPQVCGDKRKAEIADVSSPSGPNKKLKQGFSCELCQVSATSEKGLRDHVRGKKHRAKEASLKSQQIGLEEVEKPPLQPSGMGAEGVKQLLQCCITVADMNLMMVDDGAPESKAEEQHGQQNQNPMMVNDGAPESKAEEQHGQQNQNIVALEDRNETAIGKAVEEPIASTQNRFKSWCEICQVGTHSQKVMENHINGRKHRRNMKMHSENNGNSVSSSSASREVPALIVDTSAVNEETEKRKIPMLKRGLIFPDIEEPCPAAESNAL